MDQWALICALPNLTLREPVEAPYVALVPYSDNRVQTLLAGSLSAKRLLDCFVDQSGRRVVPSALLMRGDAPAKVRTADALIAFRNSAALSAVLMGWASVRAGGSPMNPLWSDVFDFHPATPGKDGSLVIHTAAQLAYVSPDAPYMGMTSPHTGSMFIPATFDRPLLCSLLRAWERRFLRPGLDDWDSRRLFRSLQVAYQAVSVPIKNEGSLYEWGVVVGLWVSALEVLAHPRDKDQKVQQTHVMDLLGRITWADSRLNAHRYVARLSKNRRIKVNLVQRLYKELYDARNAFLHGNPVTKRRLVPLGRQHAPFLVQLAPVIYGAALMAYFDSSVPTKKSSSPFGLGNRADWDWTQLVYEDCLLRVVIRQG